MSNSQTLPLAVSPPRTINYHALGAAVVFLTSFVVYLMTVGPTVAFWDCGEYIAAGHSLGIPHPPGNPLIVLLLRFSSIVFGFFEDVGYRMNFAVVIASSLTATFIYLVCVEVAKMFIGNPDTREKQMSIYIGGLVGGLFAAFGYTFWFSAVETSVYNLSMLCIAICTFLMLRWAQSKRADRDRLLILVAFLGFMGIGLHMYTMVIFPPAFLFMVLWDEKKRYNWRLWITGILMASILYSLSIFIKVGPAVLLITFIMSMLSKERAKEWRICFFFSLFAIVGYSTHLFIPLRSALEPMINENHPATWEALIGFLERDQYGSESMITRMFWRRGLWSSQFGIEEHMGFGGFHLTQFFRLHMNDTAVSFFRDGFVIGMTKLFIYLVPTAFMIFGWGYLYKRNKPAAIFLISLVLLTTIGMVFYMNFADGNRPERFDYEQWMAAGRPGEMPTVHREVRIRDYFFTAGFMFFGMWIGIAASCLLNALFSHKEKITRTITAPICAGLLVVSPIIPAMSNYELSSRRGDWSAYDYAYNLLNSAEPNGLIITNGDNDTFPLWALQEAYGIRKDVRVVNLSLANTAWYNKQLRKLEPRVPMTFTEEQLELLEPELNRFQRPVPYNMQRAGIVVMLPSAQERRVIRVSDRIVLNMTDAAAWDRPVYFSTTVSEDNFMGLGPYLRNEGLVFRVTPNIVNPSDNFNLERVLDLIENTFILRGVGEAVHNVTSRRLLINYLQIAHDLRRPMEMRRRELETMAMVADLTASDTTELELGGMRRGDAVRAQLEEAQREHERNVEKVEKFLKRVAEIMPWDWRAQAFLNDFLVDNGKFDEAIELMERLVVEDVANAEQYMMMLERNRQMKAMMEESQRDEPEELTIETIEEIIEG